MLKKDDEVMFLFFFNGGIHVGRGAIQKVRTLPVNDLTLIGITIIDIPWIENRILSLEPENVFPFDNDKYIEICDMTDGKTLHKDEMSRLRKICTGEDHV